MISRYVLRGILPIAGVALAAFLVLEARGLRAGPGVPATAATEDLHGVVAEGRLVAYPGAEVEVGTDLSGTLERVLVTEKAQVRKGEPLARIRAEDYRAELAEAQAGVSEADANLRLERQEFARIQGLVARNVDSQQNLDRAQRDLDAAIARRDLAAASVDRLRATLDKTEIISPLDGIVVSRLVDTGETVKEGQQLFTVADLSRLRIEVEVDEFDAGRIHLGDTVTITAEGYNGMTWRGTVEEIPDTVVPRRLRPTDPGRPGDTRVLLVKIALQEAMPLKLGQRVETRIGRN
jgi:HlyD family secretion protein